MATTDGTITSFTSTPQTAFQIDGVPWTVHTAGDSYSLTEPDNHTLRFELQAGDRAWYDGSNVDRAEVQRAPKVAPGTPVNISYQFMLEPGATNTASWVVTGEMHNDDVAAGVATSPPFAIDLSGEHLTIVARYVQPGMDASNAAGNVKTLTLWTDPNPIQRGQYYNIDVRANFSNNSSGYLDVFIDGKQVVDYNGPLGYGYSTYWMEGLYRSANSGTLAADFRDFTMTTGSYAPVTSTPPTTTTPPTNSTTPTTPNAAPTVTQASASPGTGTEHVGDVVTLTLAFSEAVTVTGTPTLSLNDGAKATYVGGSGTNKLTFQTTVASTDRDTSALAITGVNLPTGASIKDSGGLAAILSGAVTTFSGLQISTASTTPTTPTSPTDPTTPTAPSQSTVTKPVLTVADNSLWVAGRGGHVDLGTTVTTSDANDRITLNIKGLPKYETITTGDGHTFRGSNITLTSAQVASGLTLTSYYKGNAHPVADLTLTATATDPVTGAVTSSAPQTITVTDPRPSDWSPRTSSTSTGSLANQGYAQLQQRLGSDSSTLVTTAPQPAASADHSTARAYQASQSFALLSQSLAGSSGRVDGGQIAAAVSNGATWIHNSFLTKPQH